MNFRYPGGKKKQAVDLARLLLPCEDFREPFAGSAAVALKVARLSPSTSIWLNDLDRGIAALWGAVVEQPDTLMSLIKGFQPTVEVYDLFLNSMDDESLHLADLGFRKLALHQMSWSGLGEKAGGPVGGWGQDPISNPKTYAIDCRWNPQRLSQEVRSTHVLLRGRTRVTSLDFQDVLDHPGENVGVYLDPPYVGAGEALYKKSFTEADHRRLADSLRMTQGSWVLSYDDHPLVWDIYQHATVHRTSWSYTINSKKGKKGHELVIQPKCCRVSFGAVEDPLGDLFGR